MKKTVTIKMSLEDAYAYGLFSCTCGHAINNHFDHGSKPCARCKCTEYCEVAPHGQIICYEPMTYRRGDVLMDKQGELWEVLTAMPYSNDYMLLTWDNVYGHTVMYAHDAKGMVKIGRL
jgi:hypothetical protein